MLNLGRNYLAVYSAVSYSDLDSEQVLDISMAAGVPLNAENDDTDYATGNEFHLDWFAGRYVHAFPAAAPLTVGSNEAMKMMWRSFARF